MNLLSTHTETIKKSKFIAMVYSIENEKEAEEILNYLKAEHKKARHFPYAYKVKNTARKSDDKEPSNTAGLPILNILERENLNNTLIVVIRYFGGIKLGAGPLLRAYSKSANEAVKLLKEKISD